ncbi:MAG: ester cyclase [Candidatus Latescibacter sp.]|nr:ester cyclase [Candidatus Latescibacter sp.]
MRSNKLIFSAALLVIATTFLFICVAGCGSQKVGNEKFKAAYIRACEDAYNKGEVNALDIVLAADFVRHNPPNPDINGLEANKQHIVELRRVYPDMKLTINSMITEGNTSAEKWTFQFTDMSTGKQVKVSGCEMFQWVNGKVVETWDYVDWLGLRQQLGYKMSPPITKTTFARVTVTQMKPAKMAESVKIYEESVVPEAKKQKGFRGIMLLSDLKTGKGLSIAVWDSEADAVANEQSGYYKAQVDKFKDLLTAKPIREGYVVTVQE